MVKFAYFLLVQREPCKYFITRLIHLSIKTLIPSNLIIYRGYSNVLLSMAFISSSEVENIRDTDRCRRHLGEL